MWAWAWGAFVIGSCLGGLVGLRSGAEIATKRDQENSIPLAEYRRERAVWEKIVVLYYAERKRNVELTGKHLPAMRVVKKAMRSR